MTTETQINNLLFVRDQRRDELYKAQKLLNDTIEPIIRACDLFWMPESTDRECGTEVTLVAFGNNTDNRSWHGPSSRDASIPIISLSPTNTSQSYATHASTSSIVSRSISSQVTSDGILVIQLRLE